MPTPRPPNLSFELQSERPHCLGQCITSSCALRKASGESGLVSPNVSGVHDVPEPTNGRRRHVHRLAQPTPFTARGGKRCAAPRRVHPMLAEVLQARSHGHGRRLPAHTATTWVTGSTWYIPATSPHARDRTAARTSGDPFSTWRAQQTGARPCETAPRDAPLSTPASRGPSFIPQGHQLLLSQAPVRSMAPIDHTAQAAS